MPGADVIRACYLNGTNVIGEPLAVMFRREPFLAALPWDDSNPLVLDLMFYAKVAALGDVVVRKGSIGGFRVSTSSWSTRLASVQRQQFEQWQREYETSLTRAPECRGAGEGTGRSPRPDPAAPGGLPLAADEGLLPLGLGPRLAAPPYDGRVTTLR